MTDTIQRRDDLTTRTFSTDLEVRAIREELREVDFVCSTEELDSYGTIIRQDGWDLSRFEKNPVVLYSHDASEIPIGQSIRHVVEKKKLLSTVRLATKEANPKAEQVLRSIVEKTLRGISVGFRPLEYHWEKAKEGDGEVLVFDRSLLCELSITPLPSNASALAQARQMAMEARVLPSPTKTNATDTPPQDTPAAEHSKAAAPKFATGDKIEAKADHMPGMSGSIGTVKIVRTSPAYYGVQFGDGDKVHKWLAEDEIVAADADAKPTSMNPMKEKNMSDQNEATALKAKADASEAQTRAVTADLAETRKLLETERTAKAAFERELDKTRADLVVATERASKAEAEVIDRDVRALVGVKITPAEVEAQIALAKADRKLFDDLMSKRSVMKEMAPAIPPEPNTETRAAAWADADGRLAALAMKGN